MTVPDATIESVLTGPHCGHLQRLAMADDAYLVSKSNPACGALLRPKLW